MQPPPHYVSGRKQKKKPEKWTQIFSNSVKHTSLGFKTVSSSFPAVSPDWAWAARHFCTTWVTLQGSAIIWGLPTPSRPAAPGETGTGIPTTLPVLPVSRPPSLRARHPPRPAACWGSPHTAEPNSERSRNDSKAVKNSVQTQGKVSSSLTVWKLKWREEKKERRRLYLGGKGGDFQLRKQSSQASLGPRQQEDFR